MVATGFFILTMLMVLAVPLGVHQFTNAENSVKKRATLHYAIGMSLWLAYVIGLSKTGFLEEMSLPPRMPLMVIIPGVLLLALFASKRGHGQLLAQLPKHVPVYIQSFRIIVELLIYGTFLNGIFPERTTFEGLNYDILVGISALPIGFLVQRQSLGKKGLLVWNIICCLILTLTGYAFMSSYYILNLANAEQIHEFLNLPYILLPSVLLPFAFFYHIISIKQALAGN